MALFRFFVWVRFKKKLHEFIDQADERMLKPMYAMAQADMEKTDFELSDAHIKILEERIALHQANPESGFNWEDVKSRKNS